VATFRDLPSPRRFPRPGQSRNWTRCLPTTLQRETIRLLKRGDCRESVLSCLPRGDRAGCDLVGCSQRRAGAGGPRIRHAPLYAGGRLGRLIYFEDEPGRRSAAKLLSKDEAADRGERRQAAGAAKVATLLALREHPMAKEKK
jgi:hypothetical protein